MIQLMRRFVLPAVLLGAGVVLAIACSSTPSEEPLLEPGDASVESGSDATTDDTGGLAIDGGGDMAPTCEKGQTCGDGGVCVGGACCEGARACGDVCCGGGQLCSFLKCVTPGAVCTESDDCKAGEYCEPSLGDPSVTPDAGDAACVGGATLREGRCLPRPPICDTSADAGPADGGVTCLERCQYKPPVAASFSPTVKYAWGGKTVAPFDTDIMMTPIVVQLDDDDCDGKITARDIPEIIFSTFSSGQYHTNGVLHAISIVSGKVVDKFAVPGVFPTRHLAGGNVDGKPGNEIIACWDNGRVRAVKADGTKLWESEVLDCFMPSIADLDGDGAPEVIVEGAILNGADGTIKFKYEAPLKGPPIVSDIDGDGKLEIITGPQIFTRDGKLLVDSKIGDTSQFAYTDDWKFPGAAVADFDKDGKPEIVVMHNLNHELSIWRYDPSVAAKFTVVRSAIDINGTLSPSLCAGGQWGNTHGGGPPTIADFNGDGTPDVALAGGIGYAVFDGKKLMDSAVAGPNTFLWVKQTRDCSSASTGSTVFDFDGDGKAEVVYSDETFLRIYEGATGKVLFETCNTTATLIENPVVADVDNDGQADIVVVSNGYAFGCADDPTKRHSGVRVFGDSMGRWVRTRRVWNEHAYHITNVEEDGTIPKGEKTNWTQPGLNNFRQNKQPGGEFAAPDAVVAIEPRCPGPNAIVATVRNLGEAPLPAGATVTLRKGADVVIGTAKTTLTLYPAEYESILFTLAASDDDVKKGEVDVWATVTSIASVKECREDNNASPKLRAKCMGPK